MGKVSPINQKNQLFFIYCSKDKDLQEKLEKHLIGVENVTLKWCDLDRNTESQNWSNEILKNLKAADLIVMLMSSNFLALINEEAFVGHSVKLAAMKRHEEEKISLIPLILRSVYWQNLFKPLDLQPLPRKGAIMDRSADRDVLFTEVVKEIEELVKERKKRKQKLQEYQNLFRQKIQTEYPLSEGNRNELKQLKQKLDLTDKEIELIEESILKSKQKEQQNKRYFKIKIISGLIFVLLTFCTLPIFYRFISNLNYIELNQKNDISINKLPKQAIHDYFLMLNRGQYKTAWQKLSPAFQKKVGKYSDYEEFWLKIKKVNIQELIRLDKGEDKSKASFFVKWKYCRKKDKNFSSISDEWLLQWNFEKKDWILYPQKETKKKLPEKC